MLPVAHDDFPIARDACRSNQGPPSQVFLLLGIEHILTGYDHLLFLVGVLLGCRSVRSALLLVSGFTFGHSLSLALAALELVSLPTHWVEPAIAATIVFVGVENALRGNRVPERLVLTFAFGLIHGFGFAADVGTLEFLALPCQSILARTSSKPPAQPRKSGRLVPR